MTPLVLRAVVLVALALLLGALFGGGFSACADPGRSQPRARTVDVTMIAPADIGSAVLAECHGPLRGRMDRLSVQVILGDRTTVRVSAQLPERLRAAGTKGVLLLVGERSWYLGDDLEREVDADTQRWLLQLRELIDAAAFGPLHRASTCVRQDDGSFVLGQPDGTSYELRLQPDTLLPRSLRRAGGAEVVFVDYLQTKTTWMVQRASTPELGACELRFDLADLHWAPDFFAPPSSRAAPANSPPTMVVPSGGVGETRSPTPIPGTATAMRLVVCDDPGTWPERVAVYAPIITELERQKQRIAGFPMLFRDGERELLAAPFRQRPGGPAFAAPAGWTVRDEPDSELLVVHPGDGDFAARRAHGEQMLREALTASGRTARGPIVAQPFLHLQDGMPTAAKLEQPVVRMSVSLQPAR